MSAPLFCSSHNLPNTLRMLLLKHYSESRDVTLDCWSLEMGAERVLMGEIWLFNFSHYLVDYMLFPLPLYCQYFRLSSFLGFCETTQIWVVWKNIWSRKAKKKICSPLQQKIWRSKHIKHIPSSWQRLSEWPFEQSFEWLFEWSFERLIKWPLAIIHL